MLRAFRSAPANAQAATANYKMGFSAAHQAATEGRIELGFQWVPNETLLHNSGQRDDKMPFPYRFRYSFGACPLEAPAAVGQHQAPEALTNPDLL